MNDLYIVFTVNSISLDICYTKSLKIKYAVNEFKFQLILSCII